MESSSQGLRVREDDVAERRVASTATVPRNDPSYGLPENDADPDVLLAQLARAIEYDIIPRLMLAHRAAGSGIDPHPPMPCAPNEVEVFAALAMSDDEGAAQAMVERLLKRPVPVEAIFMDLLAPAARHLGDLWTEDLCSFTDVTIGLCRLQRILRDLSPGLGADRAVPCGRRILLLPCPGEQHTFGLLMVGEFFRRDGWSVASAEFAGDEQGLARVRAESFDVVGYSLAAEVHIETLRKTIAAVRVASRRRDLVVLVGGPLFAARPDLAAALGADGMTIDGRDAPALAERLVSEAAKAHQVHG